LALSGGLLGLPVVLGAQNVLDGWLEPALASPFVVESHMAAGTQWALLAASSVVALLGIGLAYWFYVVRTDLPKRLAVAWRPVFTLLINKYYVDDAYDLVFVRGGRRLAALLAQGFDRIVIDGVVDGGARLILRGGAWLAQFEDGHISHYAFGMFTGAMLLVVYLVLR
jgi:NADH-quinone oxidoreductase subunit L